MPICNTQPELAVTVTCQCYTLQINLQLQSIKMHDDELIRQAYFTICLNVSDLAAILSEVLGFVAHTEH